MVNQEDNRSKVRKLLLTSSLIVSLGSLGILTTVLLLYVCAGFNSVRGMKTIPTAHEWQQLISRIPLSEWPLEQH